MKMHFGGIAAIRLLLLTSLTLLVPGGATARTCAELMQRAESLASGGIVTYAETAQELRSALDDSFKKRDSICRDRSARALARLYLQGGDNRAAIRLLRKYKTADRSVRRDPELSNLLGLAFYYEEMYEEAVFQFQIALAEEPDFKDPAFNLQTINSRLVRLNTARAYQRGKQYEEAIAEYLELLSVSQNYVTGHYRLGLLYLEMGRLEEARAQFIRGIRINSRHHQAHRIFKALGDVYGQEGDRMLAAQAYMKALERKADYKEARLAFEEFKAH